ncbi:unnamed protein product [Linum trigynum]|uniref:Uncharacterized protein n=1 Tax=Linum trigynum TaxID=586398 RepID=A0AAV2E153_9ROSI
MTRARAKAFRDQIASYLAKELEGLSLDLLEGKSLRLLSYVDHEIGIKGREGGSAMEKESQGVHGINNG